MSSLRSLATMLALSAFLAGCPKNNSPTFSEEQLETNPNANFVMGITTLEKRDRATGSIDYGTAYDYFSKSATLGAGAKAHFNAGWVAEKLEREEDAVRHYQAALEQDPGYQKTMFSLANVLIASGRGSEAADIYRTFLESNPDDLAVRNELAIALATSGQTDRAMEEAKLILLQDPENVQIYRNLSAIYYEQGNLGMSQLTGELALRLNDGDPAIYNNMGVTMLEQGDDVGAIEKFKTALKLDSMNFQANMNLGYVALNSGDYALAKSCFESALAANDSDLDAKLGLAVALRGVKEYNSAGSLYDEIIKADPDFALAYYNAATLYEKYTRDFNKALKYLQKYVDHNSVGPEHPVFQTIERVKNEKELEDQRKAAEAERKRQEDERRKRNEELLKNMSSVITDMNTKIQGRPDCFEPMFVEEVGMILEQAQMVVEMEDADMAADIQTMLDGYVPVMNDSIENCSASGAPAPTEEAEDVPTEEAPAPE